MKVIYDEDDIYTNNDIRNVDYNLNYMYKIFNDSKIEILKFLVRIGLLKNSAQCNCGKSMNLIMKKCLIDGYFWKCISCKKASNIRQNSYFANTKKSLKTCYLFLYFWSTNMKQKDICKELDLNKNTISEWCFDIREICQFAFLDQKLKLGGYNKIVEIDESLFFKRKYNRGRYNGVQWVFGMIERGSKKCILIPVHDRSRQTLLTIINDYILPGTLILSDKWKSYNTIGNDGKYLHESVNHSVNFVSPDNPIVHTQNIENCWLHAKKKLKLQCGTKKHLLDGYLYEFMFRFSIDDTQKTFNELLINVTNYMNLS